MSLMNRYNDAYLVARTVTGAGQVIKAVGLVAAAAVAIGGFYLGSKADAPLGIGGMVLSVFIALPGYALGILVSAQGQILKAILDTAVNTSPLLTHDEVHRILVRSAADDPTSLSAAPRDPAKPDGRCPTCQEPFWYSDYRKEAPQLLCGSCSAEIPKPV